MILVPVLASQFIVPIYLFLFFFFAHLLTQSRNYGFLDRTQEQQYLLRVVFKETLKDIHFPIFLLI